MAIQLYAPISKYAAAIAAVNVTEAPKAILHAGEGSQVAGISSEDI